MIVKFMRKSKGSSGAVEYLLNERVEEGTAKVLQGNSKITRQLIQQIDRKQKYISGGLFFEKGEIVSNELKKRLMKDFEKMFFAGVPEDRYNILWVEHTDKDRLELNFLIPDIDLETGYGLNVWSFKRDLPVVDMWKDIQNIKYGLSDPNDPRRQRTQSERTNDARAKATSGTMVANRKEIDKQLHELVSEGAIQSREQMIELLQGSGFEITRKGKEYISIKHPDLGKKALKLKGGIYSEQFRSLESIGEIVKETERRVREYDQRDHKAELRELEERYRKYLQDRSSRAVEIYKRRTENKIQGHRIRTGERKRENLDISHNSTNDRNFTWYVNSRDIYQKPENHIIEGLAVWKRPTKRVVYQNKGRVDDRTGTETFRRIRVARIKREKFMERVQAELEEYQRIIREQVERDQQRIRTEFEEYQQKLRDRVESIAEQQYSINREYENIRQQYKGIIGATGRVGELIQSAIGTIKRIGEKAMNSVKRIISKEVDSMSTEETAKELDGFIKRNRKHRSWGSMGM